MNAKDPQNDFLTAVHRRLARLKRSREEGEPTLASQISQIGVLGWIIIFPALLGLYVGNQLDRRFASGVFWSASLLMVGIALGCWTAWRWMRAP